MHTDPGTSRRSLASETLDADLVVVGGGLAGTCCAITAARAGLRVVLIQDRPVLGGNASSEVRLWILGATSHMGSNNRWSREGGVIDEILVENLYRNREGNPVLVDTVLLEKAIEEPSLTLLLNTAVFEVEKSGADTVGGVRAFCSQNSTEYRARAPLFVDASGDGIVGFLAGAAFRMGAEGRDEFGEGLAPETATHELLGHSIYFYSKDTGRPVTYVPPSYALRNVAGRIPRYRSFNTREHGCRLWWIEYGGRLDTVRQTEEIKWELWRVVYGVWDYIKNSGEFPEAETLTLEWVGTVPGKRESRRFEGDHLLAQQDIVEQRHHDDAVSFGGWALDLHPADGVFSALPWCTQYHSHGVYPIPYRCLYSRNVANLFLAGRIISATHVAFGSTRVMATCAHGGQAVGMAAAHCIAAGLQPRDLLRPDRMARLQRDLVRSGQYIPGIVPEDEENLAAAATVSASSTLALSELPVGADEANLAFARAQLIPVQPGAMPRLTCVARAEEDTDLEVQLRTSSRRGNYTPDQVLARQTIQLAARRAPAPVSTDHAPASRGSDVSVDMAATTEFDLVFDHSFAEAQYAFVCFMPNPAVHLRLSDHRITGVLSVCQRVNKAVAKAMVQDPPPASGVDRLELWPPERRPGGKNIAMRFDPSLAAYAPDAVRQSPYRPTRQPNAWVADPADRHPSLTLSWDAPQRIRTVTLYLDTDFDHALESVLMGHPESVTPFCLRRFRILDDQGRTIAACEENHQSRWTAQLDEPVITTALRIEVEHPSARTPAAILGVHCMA